MTTNSLKWQQLQEEKRANAENERLKAQSNAIESAKVAESVRANQAKEALTAAELDETIRTHKKNEGLETAKTVFKGIDTGVSVVKEAAKGWLAATF